GLAHVRPAPGARRQGRSGLVVAPVATTTRGPRHAGLVVAGLVALAAAAFAAWTQLTGFAWTDYDDEAAHPVAALVTGHLQTFFATAPAYGGSLLLRAPFGFVPSLWHGGELAVYRMLAVPCL